ncbi:MAG: hypothetical protein IPP06_09605 [Saprospiraceae bacterium]|nr:hypothetical protein [Candidatus Vicinibacter affinis]
MNGPVSTHIFLFPFRWQSDINEKSLNEYFRSDAAKNDGWEESIYEQFETKLDYNEYQYFYPFVRDILYGKGKTSNAIFHHFSYRAGKSLQFEIEVSKEALKTEGEPFTKYVLDIKDIMLNVYDLNVGMLSFHCHNNKSNSTEKDILAINQFGRRIYPPFLGDSLFNSEMPSQITIREGENIISTECFNVFKNIPNKIPLEFSDWLPNHIKKLLPTESYKVQEILDDRMFVISWYGLETSKLKDLSQFNSTEKKYGYYSDDFWYKFVFIDVNDRSYWNKIEMPQLLQKSTYARWIDYHFPDPYKPTEESQSPTLYGSSRYSFVSISSKYNDLPQFHTNTMYYKMVELCLIQRAALINFSNEITKVSQMLVESDFNPEQIEKLYRDYIVFINKVYFREVTAQDQGIELYQLIQNTLNIPNNVIDLDMEFKELHEFISIQSNARKHEEADKLNKIAVIFLPATLVVGLASLISDKHILNLACLTGQIYLCS